MTPTSSAKASASAVTSARPVDSPESLCAKMSDLEKNAMGADYKDDTVECPKNIAQLKSEAPEVYRCLLPCAEKADFKTAEECPKVCVEKMPAPKGEPSSSAGAAPSASAAPSSAQ